MTEAGRFVRLVGRERARMTLIVDGDPLDALAGETVLTALCAAGRPLGESDFSAGPRAGFCLMGACQDCWVRLADGRRVRACTTPAEDGMRVLVADPAPEPEVT